MICYNMIFIIHILSPTIFLTVDTIHHITEEHFLEKGYPLSLKALSGICDQFSLAGIPN